MEAVRDNEDEEHKGRNTHSERPQTEKSAPELGATGKGLSLVDGVIVQDEARLLQALNRRILELNVSDVLVELWGVGPEVESQGNWLLSISSAGVHDGSQLWWGRGHLIIHKQN